MHLLSLVPTEPTLQETGKSDAYKFIMELCQQAQLTKFSWDNSTKLKLVSSQLNKLIKQPPYEKTTPKCMQVFTKPFRWKPGFTLQSDYLLVLQFHNKARQRTVVKSIVTLVELPLVILHQPQINGETSTAIQKLILLIDFLLRVVTVLCGQTCVLICWILSELLTSNAHTERQRLEGQLKKTREEELRLKQELVYNQNELSNTGLSTLAIS